MSVNNDSLTSLNLLKIQSGLFGNVGDFWNIHVPQNIEAETELRELSAAENYIIGAQSSKPSVCIVQDPLLAAYLMTKSKQTVTKEEFFDIALKTHLTTNQIIKKINHIRKVLKSKGRKAQSFNGKGIISLILPDDLNYEKKNDKHPREKKVVIHRGVLIKGALDKSILGKSYNGLIQVINKEYGKKEAVRFIDNIQFVCNAWLLVHGFSVGLKDCLVQGKKQTQEIEDVLRKCYIEAEHIKSTTSHEGIKEMRISAALSKARDIGLRIAKESLSEDNNFLQTVNSGSKGDFFNIAQITGLLGQQNLQGSRVKYQLNNGKRSLPHYPFNKLKLEQEYESKGFISSSFIKGLNPREFYFHAMSGREGVCDTAMNTAKSGYIQRRIVKLTEDLKVQYDGTVRDSINRIFEFSYGDEGLDPTKTVKVQGSQEVCDISRLVDKLNTKYETSKKK